ncbi:MAG: protein-disulfide reductase DsbD domain-containing protein [Pseudomonadota bacterium]
MRALIGLAVLAAVAPQPSAAQSNVPADVVRAEVLPGWTTADGTRMTALRLILAPGWKTYWRAPGDAGIPPHFDWSGSDNLAGVRIHWPAPDVFYDHGMRTIGYADEVVWPIEMRPQNPADPIAVAAVLDLGVCEMVCIPAQLSFAADFSGPGRMDPQIRAALAERPMPARRAGVSGVDCTLTPIADGLQLDATITLPTTGSGEIALVEAGDPSVWVSEPQTVRRGDRLRVRADLVPAPGRPLVIERQALRFTVIGARESVDIRGC